MECWVAVVKAVCVRAELPDTPSNVSVLEESSTWVRLSAEAPRRDGGMPVSHWSVKYEMVDSQRGHSASRLFTDGASRDSSLYVTLTLTLTVTVSVSVTVTFTVTDGDSVTDSDSVNHEFT